MTVDIRNAITVDETERLSGERDRFRDNGRIRVRTEMERDIRHSLFMKIVSF